MWANICEILNLNLQFDLSWPVSPRHFFEFLLFLCVDEFLINLVNFNETLIKIKEISGGAGGGQIFFLQFFNNSDTKLEIFKKIISEKNFLNNYKCILLYIIENYDKKKPH